MKIKRQSVTASSRRAVKAASGYYEVTNYVDGVPQEIKMLDSGVRFRVVRKNDGFKVLAMKQGGHFDYSVETYATPEEAADAMIGDTSTFRNRSLWDVKSSTKASRRSITAAESYGWEVPDDRAQEAYDFAIESGWWDEASLNEDIVRAISSDELAACLAFIFRNNDFQPWDDYLNGVESEDEDEDEDFDDEDE